VRRRDYPFVPRRTADLKVGDVWAVVLPCGGYGCMQVTDLRRSGVGSRSALVAGPLHWTGERPPDVHEVAGMRLLEMGLVRLKAFGSPDNAIFGNTPPVNSDEFDSNFAAGYVGSVTRVYGHLAIPGILARALSAAG